MRTHYRAGPSPAPSPCAPIGGSLDSARTEQYGHFVIQQVQIHQFRCLRALNVPLRPLTVLVGSNDTGKSTFLDALARLGHGPSALPSSDGWRGSESPTIQATVPGKPFVRRTSVNDGDGVVDVQLFRLPVGGPRMQESGAAGVPRLGAQGEGVASLVDWMLRKDRPRFDRFVRTVVEQVPGVVDIGVETPNAAWRELQLKLEAGYWLAAEQASAGVRLLLFFVALVHHPEPPELVLLEEPETGLHPKRLAYVMGLLHGLTTGAFGAKPIQVVLSTHSPHLLDEVDPAKDQVLVFRRADGGGRTAEPADAERLKVFLDEFKLGEVWFNQSESGLVRRPS
jgi:predicted ATPase